MKQDEMVEKMKGQIDAWNAEIAKLQERASTAQGEAKAEAESLVDDLKTRRDQAAAKLDEVKQASESGWDDVKGGFQSAWSSLADGFERAIGRFR